MEQFVGSVNVLFLSTVADSTLFLVIMLFSESKAGKCTKQSVVLHEIYFLKNNLEYLCNTSNSIQFYIKTFADCKAPNKQNDVLDSDD
jgi:hypothetical protein